MDKQTMLDAADLLDAAHDVMLERGRCKGNYSDDTGRVCVLGAVNVADHGSPIWRVEHETATDASACLHSHLGQSVSGWNDDPATTDDMAFDAFHTAAKELREKAGQL